MAEIKSRLETGAVRVDWANIEYRTKDNPEWINLESAYKSKFPTNICDIAFEDGGLSFCQQAENYSPHVCPLPI